MKRERESNHGRGGMSRGTGFTRHGATVVDGFFSIKMQPTKEYQNENTNHEHQPNALKNNKSEDKLSKNDEFPCTLPTIVPVSVSGNATNTHCCKKRFQCKFGGKIDKRKLTLRARRRRTSCQAESMPTIYMQSIDETTQR